MPEADDIFTITVNLLGKSYKLPVKRCDEQYFRESAKLLEKTYANYTSVFSPETYKFGVDSYLKLTALDLGVRLKKMMAQNTELQSRLEQLEKDIDKSLK